MRPGNPPRNVASFKNAESVATAPQLRAAARDGALSAAHGGSQSVLYLKMFETDYESLVADGSDKFAQFFRC
jgi:hypothetical protein